MCALIDSVMNNYYIPPVVLAVRKAADGKVLRVCIDGKQRLTSISRFMNNEIPYSDLSGGTAVDRYYCNNTAEDDGREYLDDETRDQFDHTQLVCVEYTNLDTDSEIEIFSRVQLGVPLTSAEKLKANITPVAKYCTAVYEQYRSDLSVLFADVRSYIFQHIAFLVLMIHNPNPAVYAASRLKLVAFLGDSEVVLSQDMKRSVTHALNTIVALAKEPSTMIFTHVNGRKKVFRPMEFLMFGLYVSRCRRRRQLKEYESDLAQLRFYLDQRAPSGVRFGKSCYNVGMEWIEEQMDLTGQAPALIRYPGAASPSTDDTDEVPDEDENAIEDVFAFYKTKRTRSDDDCMEASQRARSRSRPVARRGGRSPHFRH
ncbi:hypothetical protein BDB00DRAFT_794451 [Zychaea mexicana]|uniref:uncharacterized protein n=1 Tax=Zychaea mexicana TaxID=64656 RepID=UPI0022FDFA88|nr:uncharacterized protein BDB00DRAFT_794451 [Zychaea mexicana]KAI9499552.1 hypothetical protein BDB00DRAFT_794451 [Zychaea mexicana]